MSWGINTVAAAADIDMAIDALVVPGDHITESDDQIAAAKVAAKQLVASGGAGSPAYWNVSLSGHANPGHAEVAGSSNEVISVSVNATDENTFNQYTAAQAAAKENAS